MSNKIIMFASDFSGYGKIQEMKANLRYLAKDKGIRFVFNNDPKRGSIPKVRFGSGKPVLGILTPKDINNYINGMEG